MSQFKQIWIILVSFPLLWSIQCFAQSTKRNKTSWSFDYHYLAGELHSLKGHHQQSIAHFKQIRNPKPHPNTHPLYIQWRLSKEYVYHGQLHQAEKKCQQIIAKHPAFQPALRLLGEIYHTLGFQKTALYYYQKILKINPKHQQALFAQALLLLEMGHPLSDQITQPFLSNPLFHQKKGDIYWLKGDLKKATRSFKTAFQLNSTDRRTIWKLFHIYHQQETPQLFIELLEDIPQDDPYMISLLARSYLRNGNKKKTMETLENLLLDDPIVWNLKAELAMEI